MSDIETLKALRSIENDLRWYGPLRDGGLPKKWTIIEARKVIENIVGSLIENLGRNRLPEPTKKYFAGKTNILRLLVRWKKDVEFVQARDPKHIALESSIFRIMDWNGLVPRLVKYHQPSKIMGVNSTIEADTMTPEESRRIQVSIAKADKAKRECERKNWRRRPEHQQDCNALAPVPRPTWGPYKAGTDAAKADRDIGYTDKKKKRAVEAPWRPKYYSGWFDGTHPGDYRPAMREDLDMLKQKITKIILEEIEAILEKEN